MQRPREEKTTQALETGLEIETLGSLNDGHGRDDGSVDVNGYVNGSGFHSHKVKFSFPTVYTKVKGGTVKLVPPRMVLHLDPVVGSGRTV